LDIRWAAVTHLRRQFGEFDVLEVPTPPDIHASPCDNAAVGNACSAAVRRVMCSTYLPLVKQMDPKRLVNNSERDHSAA
jgi:hypothetical protein